MRNISLIFLLALLLAGCRESPADWSDTPAGTFDCLAETIGSRYCFFADKDIDWPGVVSRYRARVEPGMSDRELFAVCASMLDELQDGHVNLISSFDVSYYRKWWSDYPQDFNLRTLQQYYLGFGWGTAGGIIYKKLEKNIGYIYIPSFSAPIGESNLDWVFAIMADCDALIVDIRDNGGGLLSYAGSLASRFVSVSTRGGYIVHKTGPGASDFSEPYPFDYSPPAGHPCFLKRVAVLTNRSTFSAANTFAAFMASLPGVELIGARTGGGGGMPFSADLPNGWSVRFSASPVLSPAGEHIENGVDPSPGCAVHCTDEALAQGHDAILDFALDRLRSAFPAE